MNNATFEITDFLLEQARNVRGKQEFDDYKTYSDTPVEDRAKLPKSVCDHYGKVMRAMEKMASYGNNHWWIMLKSNDVKMTPQLASLRKKTRIYYQVFDCGIETMLISDGQLVNDINDLTMYNGKAITSWIIKNPALFHSYVVSLKYILENDREFQKYLKELKSLE